MSLTLPLADEQATRALGRGLALLARPGDVILLRGGLAAGKTTLARAFVQALAGGDEEVPSPTFTLVQTYDAGDATIWHFDLYRLEKPEDCFELGIEEAFADGICLVEWPERLGSLLPRRRLELSLAPGGAEGSRIATLSPHGQWEDRIGEIAQ